MDKIVARMRGGLGNQLFILACAYYVKGICDTDTEIVLDTREYKNYKVRNFEIFDLIQDEKLRLFDEKVDKSIVYECSRKIYHIVQKFMENHEPIKPLLLNNGLIYSKRSAEGIENIQIKKSVFLYGYFQDAKMAIKVKKILNDYICDNDNYEKIELDPHVNYIAVSIRWGEDYIRQGWPICSERYFQEGIQEIINEKYKNKEVCVLFFSDEIEKTKNISCDVHKKYIRNLTSAQQLLLMKKCQDFVISNSSFSWWGAFLGASKESIVIAPDIWYATKEKTTETNLLYENMRIRKMN